MNEKEKKAMNRVFRGESIEKVARETGFSRFWLSMVTGGAK